VKPEAKLDRSLSGLHLWGSLFRLRRREAQPRRPFLAPVYPVFPIVAVSIAATSLIAIAYYNPAVCGVFVGLGLLSGLISSRGASFGDRVAGDPMLQSRDHD
jgi:ethanolamine permease